MRAASIIGWLVLVAGLSVLSCAPIDPTAPVDPTAGIGEKRSEERLTMPTPPPQAPDGLRRRVEAAITNVKQRQLLTNNAFWTIFHGILGLGPGVTLKDPATGQVVNALDHITSGGELRGLRFLQTPWGLDVQMGPTMVGQGHQDQFTAEMTQWSMPATRPFRVDGRDFSFMDFVRYSQMNARTTANQELSWTIIQVGQHMGLDVSWTNRFNEKLHFDDMLRYELDQSIEKAACGGTHRLFGLSWCYHLHLIRGGKAEGLYKAIAEKTAKYRDRAREVQNSDGSFSTSYFSERAHIPDKVRRINTTGHILEWLAFALTDDELVQPWVQDATNALCLQILELQGMPIESGSLYHAVHGLMIYYARVYGRTSLIPAELAIPLPPAWTSAKRGVSRSIPATAPRNLPALRAGSLSWSRGS